MSRRWRIRGWWNDLVFGVRLAVGDGRTPWSRLALTTIGVGLGVAVLLLAASVPNIVSKPDERAQARVTGNSLNTDDPRQPAMLTMGTSTEFRGHGITGMLLDPQRSNAPHPPGVRHNPKPGEAVVSPALNRLLHSSDGALLRPRFPDKIVGVVGDEGLTGPTELLYYAGSRNLDQVGGYGGVSLGPVYRSFGEHISPPEPMSFEARVTVAFGVTALLVPVVVFVATMARMAEAARHRRLAALRLVGASGKQVRRIASGEALLGTVLGVALGWGLFGLARMLAEYVSVGEDSVFTSDVVPLGWYALAITVIIPVIAVVTATGSMRRAVIEPLGVVRHGRSRPRRLVWRCVPIVFGVAGLLYARQQGVSDGQWFLVCVVGSTALMLLGVPLLLPWVVERLVGHLPRRWLPWQLAIRRLQLTSGTAARSVSAIAVVLTGVIGLQIVLASGMAKSSVSYGQDDLITVSSPRVAANASDGDIRKALSDIPGVASVGSMSELGMSTQSGSRQYQASIMDCRMLARSAGVRQCHDGDVFADTSSVGTATVPQPGQQLYPQPSGSPEMSTSWRMPRRFRPLYAQQVPSGGLLTPLVLTPGAATGIPKSATELVVNVRMKAAAGPDAVELIRNTAAQALPLGTVSGGYVSEDDSSYAIMRVALLLGVLVAFGLIGSGLFVTAIEQIQERRRPMAVLAAVGTQRRALAWSALLQNAIPMLGATAVAVVLGVVLGVLTVTSTSGELALDLPGLAALGGIAFLSVLVVTGLTLPALRRATGPEGLRAE